ncbi:MAG: transposase [Spirochaetaceae bacterium]|nr:transposase [Spirochaetaceae bacterium]
MVKAPPARESVGRNPTDREKKRTKRSVAVESHGLPAGVVTSGANRHDIRLLETTLQSIVTAHPEGANLCLDAGYAGSRSVVEEMGYKAHIRGQGEEREEKERNPPYIPRRRVVAVCNSWMNRFRKLLVSYGKKARNCRALEGESLCHYYPAKSNPGPSGPYFRISS